MENGEWNQLLPCVQIHCNFKGQKHAQENERPRRKTAKSGEAGDARPCHSGRTVVHLPPRAVVKTTGSPWWLLPGLVPTLLERCVWCTFGPRVFAFDHPYWANWASFTNFFDLLSPQLHSFSYYLTHHTLTCNQNLNKPKQV